MLDKIQYRLSVVKSLVPYSTGAKRYFLLLILINAMIMGTKFLTPVFYGIFIDEVVIKKEFAKMIVVISGYVVIYLIEASLSQCGMELKSRLSNMVTRKARSHIFHTYLQTSFWKNNKYHIGDLKMRIDDDAAQIDEFAEKQSVNYFLAYVTMGTCIVILFLIDLHLAIFSSIVIPLTFMMDNWVSKRENRIIRVQYENQKQWTEWLREDIQGWREVKALNLFKHEEIQFYKFAHKDMIYNAKWINFWTARVLVIPKIKDELFMQFCLYFLGGLLIIFQKLEISQLLVFVMYYSMFSDAVKIVSKADADLQANKIYTDRLKESLEKLGKEDNRKKEAPGPDGTIQFENVSFHYQSSKKEILKNFNLTIKKGERIAIVGKSGSGKSTVIKLLAGVEKPTEGRILYSGIDLEDIDLKVLYKKIGFVMQENVLFNDTIEENLLYGKKNASLEEMVEVCIKVGIYDDIRKMPKRMKTIIGENGGLLSGGQRQRLVLARMLLQKKEVFIFDEATSGLDRNLEDVVYQTIMSMPSDRSIIVITHKKEDLQKFDRIIEIR